MKRTVLFLVAVAVALVALVVLAVGLFLHGGGAAPAAPRVSARVVTRAGPAPSTSPTTTRPAATSSGVVVPAVTQPDSYAKAGAGIVFGLDTRTLDRGAYRDTLLAEADPQMSASGAADLTRMVDERLPADALWARIRANQQWSAWVSTEVWEPGTWEQVVTAGQAEPGWAMRNVTGQQTTHYVEGGVAKVASRERTITIGMRCPAKGAQVDRCRLVLIGTTVVP